MQYTVFFLFTTKTLENQFVHLILPEEAEIQLRPTWSGLQSTCDCRYHYLPVLHVRCHKNTLQPFQRYNNIRGVKARSYRTKFWSSKPVFRCVSCSSWVPVCFLWSPTLRPECYCTPHFPLLHPGPFHATNRKNRESYSMTSAYCVYLFVLSAASSVLQSVHAHHIDSSMLPVMDLVVPYYRTAVRSDLNASQGISINIISLNEAPPITKYVNASLVSIEDGISPRLWADSSLYRSSTRQNNQFTVSWVLSKLSKS